MVTVADNLAGQLDHEERITGCPWWQTYLARVLVEAANAGPVMIAFAAVILALRDGEDWRWIVGDPSARTALRAAQDWLDAGIPPDEVDGWLRACCPTPATACLLRDHGIRPRRLLDPSGDPCVYAHGVGPTCADVPVAEAVAQGYITIHQAVCLVVAQTSNTTSQTRRRQHDHHHTAHH